MNDLFLLYFKSKSKRSITFLNKYALIWRRRKTMQTPKESRNLLSIILEGKYVCYRNWLIKLESENLSDKYQ